MGCAVWVELGGSANNEPARSGEVGFDLKNTLVSGLLAVEFYDEGLPAVFVESDNINLPPPAVSPIGDDMIPADKEASILKNENGLCVVGTSKVVCNGQ